MRAQELLDDLKHSRFASLNEPLDTKEIILLQKELVKNKVAMIPSSFLPLLHISNGFSYNTADVYGIFPKRKKIKDFLSENIRLQADKDIVVLGCSDEYFFAYDLPEKKYVLLDRDDMQVLEEYPDEKVLEAVADFLNICDEYNI